MTKHYSDPVKRSESEAGRRHKDGPVRDRRRTDVRDPRVWPEDRERRLAQRRNRNDRELIAEELASIDDDCEEE